MKSNSNILLLITLLLTISFTVFAQEPGDRQKRMEKYHSMKIAYFTDNLDLTPAEAEMFWPLYNKYEKQKGELRGKRKLRQNERNQEGKELTEKEAEVIVDQHIETRRKELELDIEFHKELKTVLPATKILKLYITEVQFREYMLKRIREDHGGAGGGRQGRGQGPQ